MMHNHALHKIHIRLRPRGQRASCGWRKCLSSLAPRTGLHHNRPSRIPLLRPRTHFHPLSQLHSHTRASRVGSRTRSVAEGSRGSACRQHYTTAHAQYSRKIALLLAASSIQPALRPAAKYFHLVTQESLPLNTHICKKSFKKSDTPAPDGRLAHT